MWKVVVADDESYVGEALKNLVDWGKLGCEPPVVASDGRELLNLIRDIHPDIVITDIKMPLVGGIEICKYISENYPGIQVIILSAYSDFEYAKAAIRYDVCEYVLKVALLEELPGAVEKAIRSLEKQGKRSEDFFIGEDSEGDGLYEQMVRYIDQNYTNGPTLDKMSEELHANRSYLSRLYKSRSGRNLFEDILFKQIEKAKEYLINTDWKIYKISEKVGFEDAGYFSRVFKKQCGLSPKEFKRKYQRSQGGGERSENP